MKVYVVISEDLNDKEVVVTAKRTEILAVVESEGKAQELCENTTGSHFRSYYEEFDTEKLPFKDNHYIVDFHNRNWEACIDYHCLYYRVEKSQRINQTRFLVIANSQNTAIDYARYMTIQEVLPKMEEHCAFKDTGIMTGNCLEMRENRPTSKPHFYYRPDEAIHKQFEVCYNNTHFGYACIGADKRLYDNSGRGVFEIV